MHKETLKSAIASVFNGISWHGMNTDAMRTIRILATIPKEKEVNHKEFDLVAFIKSSLEKPEGTPDEVPF